MLTVAIVGAGLMGRNLARVAAAAGASVSLYDTSAEVLATARKELSAISLVRCNGDLESAVAGCDLIIEAIIEDLAAKQALFERLSLLLPSAILASNTSVLPITKIAERAIHPERVVGTHWWNPPQLIPVVEVVRGERTSEETMTRTIELLTSFGKTPVRVERDVPGFVGNRLQHALWREAIALIADGVCDAETVDLMARNTLGLKLGAMGPIENADYVGLDLTLAIHNAVLPSLNRDREPSIALQALVASGKLGAKSGQGFFAWPEGARERTARRLADHVSSQLSSSNRRDHATT